LRTAEQSLRGVALEREALRRAIEPAFADARPLPQNAFKIELAKRAIVRTLLALGDVA
jgi:xanthine dehydrogenase YagS FAD-binding subunit